MSVSNDTLTELQEVKLEQEMAPSSRLSMLKARSEKYLPWLLCAVVALIAVVFNFHKLGVPSIWFDEAFSVELSSLPLPTLIHIISSREPNMELYYLLLHGWLRFTHIFGFNQTEFIVRFPSAAFATMSALIILLFGRKHINLWAGVLAALLFVLNVLQLTYAQQTRAYSLEVLLNCMSWLALAGALTDMKRSRLWWICYAITASMSIYAHLFSFLVIAAQVLAALGILIFPNVWRDAARKQFKIVSLSFVVMAVLTVPMILASRSGSKTGWLPVPKLIDIYNLFWSFVAGNKNYFVTMSACIIAGVILLVVSYGLSYFPRIQKNLCRQIPFAKALFSQQEYIPILWLLLCWLIIPIILSFIISQGQTRLFSSRYLVVVLPPLFLLIGLGVYALRNRGVQVLLALQLIFFAYSTVPLYYRSAQVEDWNSTSAWLMQRYEDGDGLVCYDNVQGCQIAMEYYLHAYPESGAHFTADSPGLFTWEKFNWKDAGNALNKDMLKTYATKHKHIFFITARLSGDAMVKRVEDTASWLGSNYKFEGQIKTRTVTIRLYTTEK